MIIEDKSDSRTDISKIELTPVFEAISCQYGYSLDKYSKKFLQRRIEKCLIKYKLRDTIEMAARLKRDQRFFESILLEFSVLVTEAFRDPSVFLAIRKNVIPILKTYPFIKIWHAGCASGEEAYSMAIILHETGLLERATIYATDFNGEALSKSYEGKISEKALSLYAQNYQEAGGTRSFSNYYIEKNGVLYFCDFLRKKILFAHHNLAHDETFSEMHMVFCRNVMIYFDKELQTRAIHLFGNSSVHRGFLCLGNKESIKFINSNNIYEPFLEKERIYRKKSSGV